ncbi:hypothetical protein GCM10009865_04130 [Aeromicrobium ponti]
MRKGEQKKYLKRLDTLNYLYKAISPVDIVPVVFKVVKLLFQGTKKDLKWEGFAHKGTFCP